MSSTTSHLERASATSSCTAAEVFAVIADLSTLPLWFYDNDPHPRIEHPTRSVTQVDDGGLRAREGVEVDVTSTEGFGTIRGRRVRMSEAAEVRFTCAEVLEGRSVRMTHHSLLHQRGGHAATTVEIADAEHGSDVTVIHETRVVGDGPHARFVRWLRRQTNVSQRLAVERVVALAESRQPRKS